MTPPSRPARLCIPVFSGVILAALALMGSACFRADIQTHTIIVPELSTEEQAALIRAAFDYTTDTSAVRHVEIDLKQKVVTVTYNSQRTARRNLEFTIADIGFHANDLPPTPRRRPIPPPMPSSTNAPTETPKP